MVTALDDLAVFQNHNGIGIADGGKAVCNDEYRSALHQLIHTLFNEGFGTGIDGGGRLVQNQNGRIGYGGAGNVQKLNLTL